MKWFVNLKVRTKLVVSFLLIAVIAAAIGALGILVILQKPENSQTFVIILAAASLLELVLAVLFGFYNAFLVVDPMWKNERIMERFSVGNLNTADLLRKRDGVTLNYKDEIGSFSRTFSQLIGYMFNLSGCVKSVAQGDLSVEVPVCCPEDQLGNGVSELVTNFHRLVASIAGAIDQVASGAELVSTSSLSLSEGAAHQASTVQQLTASLTEISSQTHLNAENAEQANSLARNAKENAADGNTQMQDMLKAMDEISISSSNINKIIKVIDDIAFQTNILALNAAVEAARAGQHGKGFAVVAEEVRNLAGRSANAARETTELIENSIQKVETGTKIANQTAKALDEIVTNVDKAAELISSIAVASAEQARGIEQVNLGIAQVSQVIQTNAATAQESAAASEELSGQAAQLKEHVSLFKLRGGKPAPSGTGARKAAAKLPSRSAAAAKISLTDDFGKY
ncbi:Methyl-accepting chemotaxis protein [Sporobacter termitidis DSM 10068]|uniref:Methyl-accepting chemotaxis protein n=1 Tax=Sporobacter termitidis DSM 10068 TaxID=1123282 RepID=A0A1M5W9N8_9FIRM|nr:Methyl-accepting chemotaxis protein [Sporobacter termitidis DSM 10068]